MHRSKWRGGFQVGRQQPQVGIGEVIPDHGQYPHATRPLTKQVKVKERNTDARTATGYDRNFVPQYDAPPKNPTAH